MTKFLFSAVLAAVCFWAANASAPSSEAALDNQDRPVLLAKAGETGV
jgi:hypothetical protein